MAAADGLLIGGVELEATGPALGGGEWWWWREGGVAFGGEVGGDAVAMFGVVGPVGGGAQIEAVEDELAAQGIAEDVAVRLMIAAGVEEDDDLVLGGPRALVVVAEGAGAEGLADAVAVGAKIDPAGAVVVDAEGLAVGGEAQALGPARVGECLRAAVDDDLEVAVGTGQDGALDGEEAERAAVGEEAGGQAVPDAVDGALPGVGGGVRGGLRE